MDETTGILGTEKEIILESLLDARNLLNAVAKRFAQIARDTEDKNEASVLAVIAGGLAILTDGINVIGKEIESDGRL